MKEANDSLYVQDAPDCPQTPEETHRKKTRWRKKVFKILFRLIEAFWMLMQITQYVCEFFKK